MSPSTTSRSAASWERNGAAGVDSTDMVVPSDWKHVARGRDRAVGRDVEHEVFDLDIGFHGQYWKGRGATFFLPAWSCSSAR